MDRTRLDDEQWLQILAVLQIHTQVRIGCPDNCREFIESVLWVLRTGAQWRQLPKERGFWNSVFKRYSRWCERGIWSSVLECFSTAADLEFAAIDSSVIRAHACAAGASGSSADNEALGRSKGGFSCKVHALTDALGACRT